MPIAQEFQQELDLELPNSRRLLERVPSDKAKWKPHPKSMALGHLTQFICALPGIMADIVTGVDLDLSKGSYTYETTEKLVGDFDAGVERLKAALASAKDSDFALTWTLHMGDKVLQTTKRKDALRNTINHFVHHRGQLTVYARLNDVPLPQLYGPTADDKSFG